MTPITLTVQVPLSQQEVDLLTSKYLVKELEGVCIRECLHVLGALVTEISSKIPLVQPEDERLEHSL